MKGGEEDGRRRDLGRDAGIGERGRQGAEIENFVEVRAKEGSSWTGLYCFFINRAAIVPG